MSCNRSLGRIGRKISPRNEVGNTLVWDQDWTKVKNRFLGFLDDFENSYKKALQNQSRTTMAFKGMFYKEKGGVIFASSNLTFFSENNLLKRLRPFCGTISHIADIADS